MSVEEIAALHVEALVSLGWRWEGRGLIPSWNAQRLPTVTDQRLATELINHPAMQNHVPL